MDFVFLSIGCFCNSVAIILLAVLHLRENRKGEGSSLSDLMGADASRRYCDKVVNSSNPFDLLKTKSYD